MFKDLLKNLLLEHGLSQRDLARGADIPPATISGWLNYGKLPDYNAIKKIAAFFDVSPDYILEITDEWGNNQQPIKSPVLSDDKKKLIELYDQLTPERQKDLLTFAKTFAQMQNGKTKEKTETS